MGLGKAIHGLGGYVGDIRWPFTFRLRIQFKFIFVWRVSWRIKAQSHYTWAGLPERDSFCADLPDASGANAGVPYVWVCFRTAVSSAPPVILSTLVPKPHWLPDRLSNSLGNEP